MSHDPETSDRSADEQFYEAAAPYWHPVARSVDVPPASAMGVTLLGQELVVFRDGVGALHALDDLCSHRGARLSMGEVAEACLRCPYHAWSFDGLGRCVSIPQAPDLPIPRRADVAAHRVTEHGSLVWVCLVPEEEQRAGLPAFDESVREGWHTYAGGPSVWQCQATRQIENVLDIAHFSVVHTDVFGNGDHLEMDSYSVETNTDGMQLRSDYRYPARAVSMDPTEAPRLSPIDFSYRVDLPFSVYILAVGETGPSVLFNVVQPMTADTCQVFWVSSAPEGTALPDEFVEMGETLVYSADRTVIEGVRPDRLPLDLSSELHLPFDRFSVAYRRGLADLGFGEATTGPVGRSAAEASGQPVG